MSILHKFRPPHLINRQSCAKVFSCYTRRTSATTTTNEGTKPTHSVKPFSEMPEALSGPRFISMFYFIYLYITKKSPALTSFYTTMKQKHGDIYKQNISMGKGENFIVMVGHPDYAKTVFQAPEKEHRRFKLQLIDFFTKKNNFQKPLALLDGKEWEVQRKPTQEKMLRPAVVANYVPLIEKVTDDFIEKLGRKDKTEDLFTDLLNYATESVGMLCFNKRLGCMENDNNPVAVHVRKLFEMLGTSVMRPRKSHMTPDSKFYQEYEKKTFEFTKIAGDLIDSQKVLLTKMKDEGQLEKYLEEEPNFLHSLLSDPRVTEESATSMVTTLFGAGIETKWSDANLSFLCENCCFTNEEFDGVKSLKRLQAVVGQPHRITRNVTKSEALLLQTYSIEVPTANETQIEHTADRVSSSILAKFHPAILSEFYPAETYGDGNCLYRAVSRAITGSESMYIVLRVLTLIEILSYPMFYDPNHTRFTDLIQDNRIVVATYLQLAKDVGMLGTYADMMHMFALSAVLKIPIRSYFPPQMNMEFVSEPYSRKVCGRNVNISEAPACTIMWTSAVIPTGHTLITNHFVPLFKRKRTETLETVYTIDEDDHDNVNPVIVDSECSTTGDCPQMDISDTDEIDESCPLISNEDDTKVHPLSNGCLLKGFMDVAELFKQLSSFTYEEAYNNIPGGIKNNVFFALKNSDNIERRKRGAISNFSDDCGVYDGPKGSTSKTYYVTDPNGVAKFVQKRKDTFGVIKTEKGKKNFIPLENQPAPDEVVELIRNYSTSKKVT